MTTRPANVIRLGLCALLLMLVPGGSGAHTITLGGDTLRVENGNAYLRIAVPARALPGFDDDGDGRISGVELARHRDDLRAQLARGVELLADGVPGEVVFEELVLPDVSADARSAADAVVLLRSVA